jgi:Spy/CpxP family protein refolding chaperone
MSDLPKPMGECMSRTLGAVVYALAIVAIGLSAVPSLTASDEPPTSAPPTTDTNLFRHELDLFISPRVQKELGLTEDQRAEIRKLGGQTREESQNIRAGLKDLSPEDRRAKLAELRGKIKEERQALAVKLAGILNDQQRERMPAIKIQERGAAALLDKDVAEKLKLSEDQVKKLHEIGRITAIEMRDASRVARDGSREDAIKKELKILSISRKKMVNLLSFEQQDRFEKMSGNKGWIDTGPLPGILDRINETLKEMAKRREAPGVASGSKAEGESEVKRGSK